MAQLRIRILRARLKEDRAQNFVAQPDRQRHHQVAALELRALRSRPAGQMAGIGVAPLVGRKQAAVPRIGACLHDVSVPVQRFERIRRSLVVEKCQGCRAAVGIDSSLAGQFALRRLACLDSFVTEQKNCDQQQREATVHDYQ